MKNYIFISYSRKDALEVITVARLLRATLSSLQSTDGNRWDFVLLDVDFLKPGLPWRTQINEAISKAEKIFVFWCEHSADSEEVKREYKYALDLKKVVVPILIDNTPLPSPLSEIHGVDLRDLPFHNQYRSEYIIDHSSKNLDGIGEWKIEASVENTEEIKRVGVGAVQRVAKYLNLVIDKKF